MNTVTVAACSLNQWALDFEGNLERILTSIEKAQKQGAKLRLGSELEVPGYGCLDHFMEMDTFMHSWEVMAEILKRTDFSDILLFIGMPVLQRDTGYNCLKEKGLFSSKILAIRPKLNLAGGAGNYREPRYFSEWGKRRTVEDYLLPDLIRQITGQKSVPFGECVIATADTTIGCEICEELWTTAGPFDSMALDGVEIIVNASGSHHELRKTAKRTRHMLNCTLKSAGVYVFSNQRGCDGDRLYFDGGARIAMNGKLLAAGKHFGIEEVEVISAKMDLDEIRTYRNQLKASRSVQASSSEDFPRVYVDWRLGDDTKTQSLSKMPKRQRLSVEIAELLPTPEEEIALGPACWLWDYLRRSGLRMKEEVELYTEKIVLIASGFFVPLSGGRDSAAVALIVFAMCRHVCEAINNGDEQALKDSRRIVGDDKYTPESPVELCSRLLFTCYMATSNSSQQTNDRAKQLATQIGACHNSVVIDGAVSAVLNIFTRCVGKTPAYHTTDTREGLALQNIQARLRMVLSYLFGQLSLWAKNRRGSLIVLSTANVDECLRGYMTKYDCSAGDINPIGSISKMDLDRFLRHCVAQWQIDSLVGILDAPPTAELLPLKDGKTVQTDEEEMGMSYAELAVFGRLRKPAACGPYSMFCRLLHEWGDRLSPKEIADKVQHFFRCYAINRHKATVLTPAYHAEVYSPCDHRYDHRPFLYRVAWSWQFSRIRQHLEKLSMEENS